MSDNTRAIQMQIRLNEDEKASIEAAAKADNRPASTWARIVIVKAAKLNAAGKEGECDK
jgi:hypothetical protein